MLIQADREMFHLNLHKVSDNLRVWWKQHEHDADTIETASGKKVDFSAKSPLRIALKMALAPVAIPALRLMYKTKNAEPRPFDRRNEDMFDYVVDVLLAFIGVLDDGYLYVETDKRGSRYSRYIVSISTHAPITAIDAPTIEEGEPNTQERSGGETLVHSRQDRNGEDLFHQNGHKQETGDSTLA